MHDLNVVPIKPVAADPQGRVGTVELGCFRLDEVIGRGAHGTTYLATQLGFDRKAVVKVAFPDVFESRNDEIVRRRYAEELRAATRVTHPNLVTLYTSGETHDGVPAIAMELVPGESLEDLLDAHPGGLPVDLLEPIFTQLAAALAALHEHGLVHHELSPRSVMVDLGGSRRPEVKVLDFGLSMLRSHPRHGAEAAIKRLYMAPEQIIGRIVPASDMFAMGAILWRALTGLEYHSHTFTVEDLRRHELEGLGHADPRSVAPGLPARIATLVGNMLAHAEHERPTAEAFLASWSEGVAELAEPSRPGRARPLLGPPPRTRNTRASSSTSASASSSASTSTSAREDTNAGAPPRRLPPPRIRPRSATRTAELLAAVEPAEPKPAAPKPVEPEPIQPPRVDLDPRLGPVAAPPTYDSLPAAVRRSPPEVDAPTLGPRVLVVDANPITSHLLVGCLRRNGCRVHGTHDPREATRSLPDEYDLVVLSTEIPDADAIDVARYLQEYHPEQWVVFAGDGSLDDEMRAAGVRELLPVSVGLPRLGEIIDLLRGELLLRPPVANDEPDAVDLSVFEALQADDPLVARGAIELFVGQTPECIARIAEGYEHRDDKAVRDECRVLGTSARALGANHLARLAQAAAEIVCEGELEHVPGFVAEMEREYGLVFRALMDAHAGSLRRNPRRTP